MAHIVKHPDVEDYFIELSLDEIRARPDGIIPEYEANRLVILKDYRMPVNLDVFALMSNRADSIEDPMIRRKVKKMSAPKLFQGFKEANGDLEFDGPIAKTVFDVMCDGDKAQFAKICAAMKTAHETALELFSICFPKYNYYEAIPSVRLTQTLFENLHWDNHQIADDFQQIRIFCNLDQRPRLWNVSHNFIDFARTVYREHNLERFAGRDPNELNNYICGDILGGTRNACRDPLPRHVVAFEPGEVWFGESRMISHQIMYGERAMVYMFFTKPDNMLSPERRFNAQVERLHEDMLKSFAA